MFYELDAEVIADAINIRDPDLAVHVLCEGSVHYLNECTVHAVLPNTVCTSAAVICGNMTSEAYGGQEALSVLLNTLHKLCYQSPL